jgi:cytochrome c2
MTLAQDVEAGKKVFKKCKACHKVGEGAKNAAGPMLNDIFGRSVGSVEGYKYSKTMIAAQEAGLIWDEDSLSGYLENQKEFMKATLDDPKAKPKMNIKIKDEQDRKDVIAYLATFSEPIEPAVVEETEPKVTEPAE